MTTVRHETVHYTAEEMAAKEAVDKATKAKRWKTQLIVSGIVTVVTFFGCLICAIVGALGNGG